MLYNTICHEMLWHNFCHDFMKASCFCSRNVPAYSGIWVKVACSAKAMHVCRLSRRTAFLGPNRPPEKQHYNQLDVGYLDIASKKIRIKDFQLDSLLCFCHSENICNCLESVFQRTPETHLPCHSKPRHSTCLTRPSQREFSCEVVWRPPPA